MLYVGWCRCGIYDNFYINMCLKYCNYGHTSNKCKTEVENFKCAIYNYVDKQNSKIANCTYGNKRLQLGRPVNYKAFNFESCESYKYIFNKAINQTNYLFNPINFTNCG